MAPDLNSVPTSPRNLGSPTRSTTAPSRSIQSAHSAGAQSSEAPQRRRESFSTPLPASDAGPNRHPRPLTAAELHRELEKEQEAVVNRLTRELTSLRQQTASALSMSSHASASVQDHTDQTHASGSSPVPLRHRSSSNISAHSVDRGPLATVSSIVPARDVPPLTPARARTQHQDAPVSHRSDITSMTAPGPHLGDNHESSDSVGQDSTHTSLPGVSPSTEAPLEQPTDTWQSNRSISGSGTRLEEIAYHRSELDKARRENDYLRRRVQELERRLSSSAQQSSAPSDG